MTISPQSDELHLPNNPEQENETLPTYVDRQRHVGFGIRFGAWLIDIGILFLIDYSLLYLQKALIAFTGVALDIPFLSDIILLINFNIEIFGLKLGMTFGLASWLYYALFECSALQATPGKILCNIVVTDISGKRISFFRASNRFFGKILSCMTLGIGFVMIALTDRNQGLHDKLSGCLVIRERSDEDVYY